MSALDKARERVRWEAQELGLQLDESDAEWLGALAQLRVQGDELARIMRTRWARLALVNMQYEAVTTEARRITNEAETLMRRFGLLRQAIRLLPIGWLRRVRMLVLLDAVTRAVRLTGAV